MVERENLPEAAILAANGAGGGTEGNGVPTSTCQFRPERTVPASWALGLLLVCWDGL